MKTYGPHALALCLALLANGARAAEPEPFASKPHVWREDEKDKRFWNTRLAKVLSLAPTNAACERVAASYLMALAEAAPFFHKKDDRLVIFEGMVAPLESPQFAARDFLVHLLHRVAIDGKAPEAWLATARKLKERIKAPIDLARLAYAVDGIQPVDSVELSLAALLSRYEAEVHLAPSLAQASALERFEDRYLDRDVVWSGLMLADIRKEEPKKGAKRASAGGEAARPAYLATFLVPLRSSSESESDAPPFFQAPKPPPIRLRARLATEQYLDIKATVRSARYVVHGRLWGFKAGGGKAGVPSFDIDLREAFLFDDRDWSHYEGFASAEDAAACDACRNDLSPLGLKEAQGVGNRDGFSHP